MLIYQVCQSRARLAPGASGGLWRPPALSRVQMLVVGFASFLGCQPCSCLADPEISVFPGHLQGRPGQWAPQSAQQKTPEAKVAGFRVTNNLVSHSKGERSPRRDSCPSTWRCSSRSTNSLGLHSSCKRWCE